MRISTSLCCFILLGISSLGGQSGDHYGKHIAFSVPEYTMQLESGQVKKMSHPDFQWASELSANTYNSSPSLHLEAAVHMLTGQEKKAARCSERIRYVF